MASNPDITSKNEQGKAAPRPTTRLCLTLLTDDYARVCEVFGRKNIATALVQLATTGKPPLATVAEIRDEEAGQQRVLHKALLRQLICALSHRAAQSLPEEDCLVFQAALLALHDGLEEL
jgi:hypothetical protein